MIHLHHERMSDAFEKYHILGLPFSLALHHFTGPDHGDPHDHPWGFTSTILRGGYVEEVFAAGPDNDWYSAEIERQPGTTHHTPAERVHRIVALSEGECWTLVRAGPDERETRFWRRRDGVVESRAWHDGWPA